MMYQHKLKTECGWCKPAEMGSGAALLLSCSCWVSGEPQPCDSPRCPATYGDDVPIGSYRMTG